MSEPEPFRIWQAASGGDLVPLSWNAWIASMGYSQSAIAGVEILVDDGMPMDKAVSLMRAADRMDGDPESRARHILTLRRSLR